MNNSGKGPHWFPVKCPLLHYLLSLPPEHNASIGQALRAAIQYFEVGEYDESLLDPYGKGVFNVLKEGIDHANESYAERVANGKKGGRPRRNSSSPKNTFTEEKVESNSEDEYLPSKGEQPYISNSDDDWGAILREVGKGYVVLSVEEISMLCRRLLKEHLVYYIEVIGKCAQTGKIYRNISHAQAILKMAQDDGRLLNDVSESDEPQKDFFEAAVHNEYCGMDKDNDPPEE